MADAFPTRGRGSAARSEARRFAEIFALTGVAVTQPVLSVFGDAPEWFVFRAATKPTIVAFAVLVTIVPALVVWALTALVGYARPTARPGLQAIVVAGLAGGFAVRLLQDELATGVAIAAGIIVVAGAAWLQTHSDLWRTWLAALALAPVAFAANFLFVAPVSDLLWADGSASEAAADVDGGPPVVMLVIDELPTMSIIDPSGAIDIDRFPNLADFAGDATWYRNYSALSGRTDSAVPTMLTGLEPESGQEPLWTDHPDNLFTLLGGSYRLDVSESFTQLCPPRACGEETDETDGAEAEAADEPDRAGLGVLLGDAVDVWLDRSGSADLGDLGDFAEQVEPIEPLEPGEPQEPGEVPETPAESAAYTSHVDRVFSQPTRFGPFIDGLRPAAEPTLHFLHLVLPHSPWAFYPSGVAYRTPEPDHLGLFGLVWIQEWATRLSRQRHLLQAQYVDGLIGEMLDQLRRTGLYEEALVVVAADHGGAFTVGSGFRTLNEANQHELLWVPLLIKEPGQTAGRADDRHLRSVDLLPTIAETVGAELPWGIDGLPASAPERTTDIRPYFRFDEPFQSRPDEVVEIDGEAAFAATLDGAFTPLADPAEPLSGLYRRRADRQLIGMFVEDLDVAAGSVGAVRLEESFTDVDFADPIPGLIRGDVDAAGLVESADAVIAVNGRVAGVSPVFSWESRDAMFATLIPESALVTGDNEVAVYLRPSGDSTLLRLTTAE